MKRILVSALFVMSPIVSSATVLESDSPSLVVAAEPLLLTGNVVVMALNLHSIENRSLLWSGIGMAFGSLTLALATADSAAIPTADAILGTMGFFVGLARFPRSEAARLSAGFDVGWRAVRVVARF